MDKQATITRYYGDSKQTLGSLMTMNGTEVWTCKVLELCWDMNINNKSCIPKGMYHCKYTRSNRLSAVAGHDVFTYEVLNVQSRSGIRIHSANYFYQLLGCIALGDNTKDINADSNLDITHSGNTVAKFVEIMNKEDFILYIQ
jgi:hypothetical protein